MPTLVSEAAFFLRRIEISTAKALASTDSCARASHFGIAEVYTKRLADLRRAIFPADTRPLTPTNAASRDGYSTVGALARWDDEGGAVAAFTTVV